ncbi:transcription factor Opi1-domain-containing protein [Mrakia frigida]|uniref:transcriptional regulator OPI1 n=1 Tax=Mrakia frigida TaxID=29902 RepID=UPI003FCBF575
MPDIALPTRPNPLSISSLLSPDSQPDRPLPPVALARAPSIEVASTGSSASASASVSGSSTSTTVWEGREPEEDEMIALSALGELMAGGGGVNGLPSLTPSSTAATTPSAASNVMDPFDPKTEPEDFVSRVSLLPVVSTSLRAYEVAKGSSRVVKYGAEMLEGSVKTISRPVMDRIDPRGHLTGAVGEWGCRTLDRVGFASPNQGGPPPIFDRGLLLQPEASSSSSSGSSYRGHPGRGEESSSRSSSVAGGSRTRMEDEWSRADERWEEERRGDRSSSTDRLSSTPQNALVPQSNSSTEVVQQQPPQQSRWSSMLVEAGMTAGGIGAAVSEESMKSLKYCLQWLQYATAHIENRISVLRSFILSLSASTSDEPIPPNALISPSALVTLSQIKRDVVETIRKVVDVVSKYAGGALPEPARDAVRGFILHLPERWADANQRQMTEGGGAGAAGTGAAGGAPTTGVAKEAAGRVLTLAVESLDMLQGVAQVFGESLERAESWIERLRVLGLQRQQARRDPQPPLALPPPTTSLSSNNSHSHSSSSTSPFGPPLPPYQHHSTYTSAMPASASEETSYRRGSSRRSSVRDAEEEEDGEEVEEREREGKRGRIERREVVGGGVGGVGGVGGMEVD